MRKFIGLYLTMVLVGSAFADFEVYFMRHGETPWNRAKVLQGSVSETDLTPVGIAMAEETAATLARDGVVFDRVYASPYLRARHTAEIIAKASVAKRVGKDRAGNACDQVVVSFPAVQSTKTTPRAYDYEVTAILSKGVVSRVVSQKRVYSPKCYWPERYDTNDVVCVFGRAEIPDNHESVKFVVRPMNAWGKAGEALSALRLRREDSVRRKLASGEGLSMVMRMN